MIANALAAMLAVTVATPPGPPESPPSLPSGRTDPKTWAREGWQTLRWGMGPADVNDRMSDPKGPVKARDDLECRSKYLGVVECSLDAALSQFTLLGLPVQVTCVFVAGLLGKVVLALPTTYDDFDAQAKRFLDVRNLLIKAHGKPAYEYRPKRREGGGWICGFASWKLSRPTALSLAMTITDGGGVYLEIEYSQTAYSARKAKAESKRTGGDKF